MLITQVLKKDEISTDRDLKFNEIYIDICKELIRTKQMKSLQDIEEMDCIEIGSSYEEMNSLFEKYSLDGFCDIFSINIPFITEGVIRVFNKDDNSKLYMHFYFDRTRTTKKNIKKEKNSIRINVYKEIDNNFIKVIDFNLYEDFKEQYQLIANITCVRPGFDYVRSYYDMMKFSQDDRRIFMDIASSERLKYKQYVKHYFSPIYINEDARTDIDHIINLFIRSIVTTNILLYLQQRKYKRRKSEKKDGENKPDIIDAHELPITDNKSRKRREIIIDGIKFRKGTNTEDGGSQIRIQNGCIIRRSPVWGVSGHWRHYASGKTIYINPYKKGPDREYRDPEPKTYKVVDKKEI